MHKIEDILAAHDGVDLSNPGNIDLVVTAYRQLQAKAKKVMEENRALQAANTKLENELHSIKVMSNRY